MTRRASGPRRPAASMRRARQMHTARIAAAQDPAEKVRAGADLVCAVIRRADPKIAQRVASDVITAIGRVIRDHDRGAPT